MFFQPPGGPDSPWSLGSYRSHDILIWVMLVFAVVMAFFLLMEFFNNRKGYHLIWGSALILTFISFHQVANTGVYTWLIEGIGTGFLILIPGLVAAGILLATFKSKPIIGHLYLLLIVIVAMPTIILGLPNVIVSLGVHTWLRLALVAGAGIVSIGIILGVPIYTTLISKETTSKAYFMVASAALLLVWLVGFIISMTLVKDFVDTYNAGPAAAFNGPIENIGLFWVFGLFPYIFIFSITFAVLGVLYEPSWKFPIPGVDVEDETRIEPITIQRNMPLVSSAICIAGGVILLIGAVFASWINISQSIINALSIGILMIGSVLGTIVGAAVLMGWDAEGDANTVIRIGLGAITLIFAFVLIFLPVWSIFYGTGDLMTLSARPIWLWPESAVDLAVPSTFTLAEYQMKETIMALTAVFIYVGPLLILGSGILSEFVFKE